MSWWLIVPLALLGSNIAFVVLLEVGRRRALARRAAWDAMHPSYRIPVDEQQIAELEASWRQEAA